MRRNGYITDKCFEFGCFITDWLEDVISITKHVLPQMEKTCASSEFLIGVALFSQWPDCVKISSLVRQGVSHKPGVLSD